MRLAFQSTAIPAGTPPTGIVAATRQAAIRRVVLPAGCADAATAAVVVAGTSPARAATDRINAHRAHFINPRLLGYQAVARQSTSTSMPHTPVVTPRLAGVSCQLAARLPDPSYA